MTTDKETTSHLKKNTVISALSLFFQSGYSAVLGLFANLIITIFLTPAVFGIYITVLSLISLLNYFSDIGLAASLIQKKELSDDDIATTFTIQQILIVSLVTIGWLSASYVQTFYHLPIEGKLLFQALLVSFFISSLKTIPSVLLERKIQFQKIVFVQIIENTIFYLAIMIFAIKGLGLMSFTYGVLLRSAVGLVLIYSISFWIPRFGISKKSLKELLTFGFPFQASSFLALFKDDLITLFLGKVLGFEALGYIGWAKKWAEAPIRIIMDNISRVLFPVISRLQHDRAKISRLIEKILDYQTTLLAPTLFGLAIVMSQLTHLIPKYSKWTPALPIFYIFCLSAFFSSYSTPFMNLFNALGKVKTALFFMFFWTVTTWITTPLFSKLFGIYGFPMTQLLLSSTFVFVIQKAKKLTPFSFLKSVSRQLVATLIMGTALFAETLFFGTSLASLTIVIISGIIIYLVTLRAVFKIDPVREFRLLFSHE